MGNSLITLGVFIVIAGILLNLFPKAGLPLLPGDILFRKDNVTFYFPVVTSIILSIILTVLFHLFRK